MHLIHRCQQGFTTVTLMGVLMVGGLLVTASFAAINPDIGFSKKDEDMKEAYAAAEAGIHYYLNRLGQDNNYYLHCTNVTPPSGPGTSPVNQVWNGSGSDPRVFRSIPGYTAKYAIELLPATGYSSCQENVGESMVNPSTGTFRIRSTGISGSRKRSIVATLRRKSFIDFLYFTDFETLDPLAYATSTDQAYAAANCNKYRAQRGSSCTEINFISADNINGPLHTNDSIQVCGTPSIGRDSNDAVELNGSTPGWVSSCSGSTPNFVGTRVWPGGVLPMPPTNSALKDSVDPAYLFTGETTLVFNGSTVTVTTASGSTTTKSLPANGLIYVQSSSCTSGYTRQQTYAAQTGCGNVRVKGTYNSDITIGADNDIIVTDDFKRGTTNTLAGLIANNFVRVYHPVSFSSSTSCTNSSGGPGTIEIDAAILALSHSFIVDNWYCGSALGSLTVVGAVAQKYRGPVGTGSGGSVSTGYSKNYSYNDNLRYREPPYFIDPVLAAWKLTRQNEQVPAR